MSQEQSILSEMTRLCGFPVTGKWEKVRNVAGPFFSVSAEVGIGITSSVPFYPDEVLNYDSFVIRKSEMLKATVNQLKKWSA